MSFLAPLYVAGILAISLPIIFHLIRRTPTGKREFSSLMFLSPSPPRITKRSRLNNILLLLLRAAALALLAFAFARPFFRQDTRIESSQPQGRRIAVLVDTSASMQRGDLWLQAVNRVDEVLRDVTPADEVGLYFFDRSLRPALTLREWNETDPSRRKELLRARLAETKPTWAPTNAGEALAAVADLLSEAEGSQRAIDRASRQVVLISDMQQGAHLDALQGHQWPEQVLLEVKPVALKKSSNASVQMVKDAPGAGDADGKLRVRVSNQADSEKEQFSVAWSNERGPVKGIEPVTVYATPGRAQVVKIAWPADEAKADRLVLQGDDSDFDNTLFLVSPRVDSMRVVFIGNDVADDTKGLLYYLTSAVGETARRKVEVVARKPQEALTNADLLGTRIVVVGAAIPEGKTTQLKQFVETGGDVLWVLSEAAGAQSLKALAPVDEATEATVRDYSLLGRVDVEHPIFAPFADARFGDFTKIHFWKHRKVKVADGAGVRVVAAFDDGSPWLIEQTHGQGRVLVMTSGWQPADSQLALSTKFVPLIEGFLRRKDGALVESQYGVLEPIALPKVNTTSSTRNVTGPDGRRIEIASTASAFEGAEQPGIYRLDLDGTELPVAVNVSPDESRTTPVAPEELERWGAKLGSKAPTQESVERKRQLQVMELENRQKLWRWLIVGVLGFVVAETALAGYLARRGESRPAVQ